MGKSLTRKIIEAHYVSGSMTPGEEVFIKVDQTLTHDINAVMTYLAFEAIGLDRIRTECMSTTRPRMIIFIYSPPQNALVSMFPDRVTVSAMRSMLQDSVSRARSAWAVTAILRMAERSECSVSESVEWMLRQQ